MIIVTPHNSDQRYDTRLLTCIRSTDGTWNLNDTISKIIWIKVTLNHIGDTAFTIVVIHPLCISTWRGLWELVDLGLFPDNQYYSTNASFGTGYITTLLAYGLQYIIQLKTMSEVQHITLVYLDQSLTIIAHFGTTLTWHGWWKTLTLFGYSSEPVLKGAIGHVSGFLGLTLLGASSTLAARGSPLDGSHRPDSLSISLDYVKYYKQHRCHCCHADLDD